MSAKVDNVPAELLDDADLRVLAKWQNARPPRVKREHLLAAVRNRFPPDGLIPIHELPEST